MLKLEKPEIEDQEKAAAQALLLDEAERKRIRAEMEEQAREDANAASGLPVASKDLLLNRPAPEPLAYKTAGLEGLLNGPCRRVVASQKGEIMGEILGDCVHITSSAPPVLGVELCMPLHLSGASLKNTAFGEQLGIVFDFARKDKVPLNYTTYYPPEVSGILGQIPGEVAFRIWDWQSSPFFGRLPPDTDMFVPLNLGTWQLRENTTICADIFETNITYCPIARYDTSFFARLPRQFGEPELPPPDSACPSLDFLLGKVQEEMRQMGRAPQNAWYEQSDMTAANLGLMNERGRYEGAMATRETEVRGLPSCPLGKGLIFEGETYRCG
jgi:hypothetical protein